MLHHRMRDPTTGLPDAYRAIELNPRSAMALYIRAEIFAALGRNEEAAAGMRAALAIDARIKDQMDAFEAGRQIAGATRFAVCRRYGHLPWRASSAVLYTLPSAE